MAFEYQLNNAVGPNVPELVLAGLEVLPSLSPNTESSQEPDYPDHPTRSCKSTELYSYTTGWETYNFSVATCRSGTYVHHLRRIRPGVGSKSVYACGRDTPATAPVE
jgi:hypothetical protein